MHICVIVAQGFQNTCNTVKPTIFAALPQWVQMTRPFFSIMQITLSHQVIRAR